MRDILEIREAGLRDAVYWQSFYINDLMKDSDKDRRYSLEETFYYLDKEIQREINQRKFISEIVARY